MKRFILKSILFLAILCIIDLCAANVFLLRDKVKSGTGKKVNYVMNESEEDLLILGSSRAVHHYNPEIFQNELGLCTYNAGIDGNGIILMSGLLDKRIERKKPKIILYELTPGFDYEKNDNVKYLFFLKPYFNDSTIHNLFKEVDAIEYLKMHSALYRLNSYALRLLQGVMKTDNDEHQGYIPLNNVMNYEPKAPKSISQEPDSVKLKFLKELIQVTRKNNILLIFTISPVYSYSDSVYYTLKDFIEKENSIVLDLYEDSGFMYQKNYFSDRTHLNKVGADTLSYIIVKNINTLNK